MYFEGCWQLQRFHNDLNNKCFNNFPILDLFSICYCFLIILLSFYKLVKLFARKTSEKIFCTSIFVLPLQSVAATKQYYLITTTRA